jgi:hypothetical protein
LLKAGKLVLEDKDIDEFTANISLSLVLSDGNRFVLLHFGISPEYITLESIKIFSVANKE